LRIFVVAHSGVINQKCMSMNITLKMNIDIGTDTDTNMDMDTNIEIKRHTVKSTLKSAY
jgi:hypothetical protein